MDRKTDGLAEGWMDRLMVSQTDSRTDRRMDGWTNNGEMDGQTDRESGWMDSDERDGRMDKEPYARTHLKMTFLYRFIQRSIIPIVAKAVSGQRYPMPQS